MRLASGQPQNGESGEPGTCWLVSWLRDAGNGDSCLLVSGPALTRDIFHALRFAGRGGLTKLDESVAEVLSYELNRKFGFPARFWRRAGANAVRDSSVQCSRPALHHRYTYPVPTW